jgi:hypothetical protein
LLARILHHAGIEQQPRQVRPGWGETGVYAQGGPVVFRGEICTLATLGEYPERVVGLRYVGIESAGPLQKLSGLREIASLQLHQPLVGQRIDEVWVIFEC